MNQHPEWVKFMREQYPPGTRIRLTEMRDPYDPVPPGTEGALDHIDDACQFHMKWDNGRTLALIPGVDRFSVLSQPLQTLKLYIPLTVFTYENEDEICENPVELEQEAILTHQDSILAALLKERAPEESERGLMKYYHGDDGVNDKVQSFVFTAERVGNRLMGVALCRIQGELAPEELEKLKAYVSGQSSDGFGEGLENRAINTADGEIFVSLWSSDKSWSIMTQDELAQSRRMGGMTLE